MSRTVLVNVDNLALPDGEVYQSGDVVTLTDAQFAEISPASLGDEVTDLGHTPEAVDSLALLRLERTTLTAIARSNALARARRDDAVAIKEPWTDTAAWAGTGTVGSNRVISAAGLTRGAPSASRWVARTYLHTTGTAGKFAYFGVGASAAAADLVGIGQGSASTTAAILRGANVPSAAVVTPRALPALAAGDYLVTVSVDPEYVSLTIQPLANAGQAVYGARVKRSSMPSGGAINTIFLSANDTATTGLSWGPVVIYPELAIPAAADRTVGGAALFGAGKPLLHLRADTTGFGHFIHLPGDLDARVPAPLVFFAHQSLTGVGMAPWTESRLAGIQAALESNGYVLLSSDSGPGITGGGTQDRYGNQSALDDAEALIRWARDRVQSGALFLLGASMGNYLIETMLAQRKVGGIAAVAGISGNPDLRLGLTDGTYRAPLLAAYGATDDADFAVKAAGYNPAQRAGWEFRGVPHRVYLGTADAMASPDAVAAFKGRLEAYGEFTVVSAAVGHLDPALYQGSDLVAFFNRHR